MYCTTLRRQVNGELVTAERGARHHCDQGVAATQTVEAAGGESAVETAETAAAPSAFGEALWAEIEPRLGALIDRDEIARIAEAAARNVAPITVEVKREDGIVIDAGRQHEQFPTLIKMLSAHVNVAMVGPAGTGKTRAAEEAAKVMGLDFYPKSVGPSTEVGDLFGLKTATGDFSPGIVLEPFINGGLLLLDELDAGSGEALVALNTLLANGYASFPDGSVRQKSENFYCVVAMNTFGQGAAGAYTRLDIDGATLDRLTFLPWGYDRKLERDIAASMANELRKPEIVAWCEYVQSARDAAEMIDSHAIIGTRSIIEGAKLIGVGFTLAETAEARIWASIDPDESAKIKAGM